MTTEVFEQHYENYCAQIARIDLAAIRDRLGVAGTATRLVVPFFGKHYFVGGSGITDERGERPAYLVCVILAKYVLLCPDRIHHDPEWASLKDLKKVSHFLNLSVFRSDTEQAVATTFSGKPGALCDAGKKLGGVAPDTRLSYDLCLQFSALPRISLLLLFNDRDEEFPAQCSVLFQKQAEEYLDPESLIMTGTYLAASLKQPT